MRRRTSAGPGPTYPLIMELREDDMNTFGSKVFGAIIGSTIFFGVGIALAHAGAIIA